MNDKYVNKSQFSTKAQKMQAAQVKAIETEELQKSVAKDLARSERGKEKYQQAQAELKLKAELKKLEKESDGVTPKPEDETQPNKNEAKPNESN